MFTHTDSQINKLLSEARFTRHSSRSSFGRVDYYSQAEKHRLDHYQRLHTSSKLLYRRIQLISGSSDDDDGYTHTGRLQCSPLIVLFKFYRFESTMLESMVSGSNFGILNCDSPTRLPGNANSSSLMSH